MRSRDHMRLVEADAFIKECRRHGKSAKDVRNAVDTFASTLAKTGLVQSLLLAIKSQCRDSVRYALTKELASWLISDSAPTKSIASEIINQPGHNHLAPAPRLALGLVACQSNSKIMAIQAEAIAWVAKLKLVAQARAAEETAEEAAEEAAEEERSQKEQEAQTQQQQQPEKPGEKDGE